MEEKRTIRIYFNKAGSGSYTPKITLPSTLVREMGIVQENREAKVNFSNNKIIIEKGD